MSGYPPDWQRSCHSHEHANRSDGVGSTDDRRSQRLLLPTAAYPSSRSTLPACPKFSPSSRVLPNCAVSPPCPVEIHRPGGTPYSIPPCREPSPVRPNRRAASSPRPPDNSYLLCAACIP